MNDSPQSANPQPVDAAVVPRFSGFPTFMRLPAAASLQGLDIALIGVPFDGGTTNRAGARHGPREVRNQSSFIRRVHHVSGIAPYDLARIADVGDVRINPIDLMDSLKRIEAFFADVAKAGVLPLSVGGDHLMTLPILRGIAAGRPVGMVHFDAHSDTNDTYFGNNPYTHGTPFRRAVEEGLLDPKRVIQIGIRGSTYDPKDLDFAREAGFRIVMMEEFMERTPQDVMAEARQVVGEAPVYISFDVDALDPSQAPGTGTPEIGGITTREAQQMLRLLRGLNIVGGDVVEVSPPFDPSGMTALVGATMMWEILCIMADSLAARRG